MSKYLVFILIFLVLSLNVFADLNLTNVPEEHIRFASRPVSSWFIGKETIVDVSREDGTPIASIRSNSLRSSVVYHVKTFLNEPFVNIDRQTVTQRLAPKFNIIDQFKDDPRFVQKYGFPRIANVMIFNDSIYALVWTLKERQEGVSGSMGHTVAGGVHLRLFEFVTALLVKLDDQPGILKAYRFPDPVSALGEYISHYNLQNVVATFADAEVKTNFNPQPTASAQGICARVLNLFKFR